MRNENGSIACEHVKKIAGNCSQDIPTGIRWEDSGPVLKSGSTSIYRFDGSTSASFPTRNSCDVFNKDVTVSNSRNHKSGVLDPYGQILIK